MQAPRTGIAAAVASASVLLLLPLLIEIDLLQTQRTQIVLKHFHNI
jgi:hypothetical protein